MPPPFDVSDDLKQVMARAFDRAWERFARPGIVIDTDTMRTALARHIVGMVRDGETDEGRLSAGGFVHLTALQRRGAPRPTRPRW